MQSVRPVFKASADELQSGKGEGAAKAGVKEREEKRRQQTACAKGDAQRDHERHEQIALAVKAEEDGLARLRVAEDTQLMLLYDAHEHHRKADEDQERKRRGQQEGRAAGKGGDADAQDVHAGNQPEGAGGEEQDRLADVEHRFIPP